MYTHTYIYQVKTAAQWEKMSMSFALIVCPADWLPPTGDALPPGYECIYVCMWVCVCVCVFLVCLVSCTRATRLDFKCKQNRKRIWLTSSSSFLNVYPLINHPRQPDKLTWNPLVRASAPSLLSPPFTLFILAFMVKSLWLIARAKTSPKTLYHPNQPNHT